MEVSTFTCGGEKYRMRPGRPCEAVHLLFDGWYLTVYSDGEAWAYEDGGWESTKLARVLGGWYIGEVLDQGSDGVSFYPEIGPFPTLKSAYAAMRVIGGV